MKFIFSRTALTNFQEQIPSGTYNGVHLRFAGTNNAGQTMAFADIGNILLLLNGVQIGFIPSGFLADLNNQWEGYAESSSTAGAAFALALKIPFEIPGFPNALNVGPNDELWVEIQFAGAVATKVSSWSIECNGIASGNPENYIPYFAPANESPGAAGTFKKPIKGENIFSLWVNSTVVTRLQMERDKQLIHSCSYNALISETSIRQRVEAALISYANGQLGDQVSDLLSEDVQIEYTVSGAGAVNIQYLSVIFDDIRRSNSLSRRADVVEQRLNPIARTRPKDVQLVQQLG